jgi:hypothetical protein
MYAAGDTISPISELNIARQILTLINVVSNKRDLNLDKSLYEDIVNDLSIEIKKIFLSRLESDVANTITPKMTKSDFTAQTSTVKGSEFIFRFSMLSASIYIIDSLKDIFSTYFNKNSIHKYVYSGLDLDIDKIKTILNNKIILDINISDIDKISAEHSILKSFEEIGYREDRSKLNTVKKDFIDSNYNNLVNNLQALKKDLKDIAFNLKNAERYTLNPDTSNVIINTLKENVKEKGFEILKSGKTFGEFKNKNNINANIQKFTEYVNVNYTTSDAIDINLRPSEKFYKHFASNKIDQGSKSNDKSHIARLLPVFHAKILDGTEDDPIFIFDTENDQKNSIGVSLKNPLDAVVGNHILVISRRKSYQNSIPEDDKLLEDEYPIYNGWNLFRIPSPRKTQMKIVNLSYYHHPFTAIQLDENGNAIGYSNKKSGLNTSSGFSFGQITSRVGLDRVYPPQSDVESCVGLFIPLKYNDSDSDFRLDQARTGPFYSKNIVIDVDPNISVNISNLLQRDPPEFSMFLLDQISLNYIEFKKLEFIKNNENLSLSILDKQKKVDNIISEYISSLNSIKQKLDGYTESPQQGEATQFSYPTPEAVVMRRQRPPTSPAAVQTSVTPPADVTTPADVAPPADVARGPGRRIIVRPIKEGFSNYKDYMLYKNASNQGATQNKELAIQILDSKINIFNNLSNDIKNNIKNINEVIDNAMLNLKNISSRLYSIYESLPLRVINKDSSSSIREEINFEKEKTTTIVSNARSLYVPMHNYLLCEKLLNSEEFSSDFIKKNVIGELDTNVSSIRKEKLIKSIKRMNNIDLLFDSINSLLKEQIVYLHENSENIEDEMTYDKYSEEIDEGRFGRVQKIKLSNYTFDISHDDVLRFHESLLPKIFNLINNIYSNNLRSLDGLKHVIILEFFRIVDSLFKIKLPKNYIPLVKTNVSSIEDLDNLRNARCTNIYHDKLFYDNIITHSNNKYDKWHTSTGWLETISDGSIQAYSSMFPTNTGKDLDIDVINAARDKNLTHILPAESSIRSFETRMSGLHITSAKSNITGERVKTFFARPNDTSYEAYINMLEENKKQLNRDQARRIGIYGSSECIKAISEIFKQHCIDGIGLEKKYYLDKNEYYKEIFNKLPDELKKSISRRISIAISKKAADLLNYSNSKLVIPSLLVDNIRLVNLCSLIGSMMLPRA